MRPRLLGDWLPAYMEYVENSESPASYHRWAGISLIAGAMQRKSYFKRGHSVIYPNQYIVLVGPSGLSRKGEPIQIARSFLEQIHIPILAENNSKESIARDLQDFTTNFTDSSNGRIMMQAAMTCFSEELSVFCGYQDTQFLAFMTNWYDSRDKWERRTKHQGIDEVNGVCLNFLSATDPSWLPGILPKEAIGGGFTSRIMFVVEDHKAKTISNPDLYPPNERLRSNLLADLEMIHSITGPFKLDKHARSYYDQWYEADDAKLQAHEHPITEPYLMGYAARRPTHLIKVAMALSASKSSDRIISLDHIRTALGFMEEAEVNMPKVFKNIGTTKFSMQLDIVMDYIQRKGRASRSEIIRAFGRHIDSYTFDAVAQTLIESRRVLMVITPGKDDPILKAC